MSEYAFNADGSSLTILVNADKKNKKVKPSATSYQFPAMPPPCSLKASTLWKRQGPPSTALPSTNSIQLIMIVGREKELSFCCF